LVLLITIECDNYVEMINFKQGNLLEENVEALVNTVNCVGVMGKGIALQFKQAYPDNFKQYKKACDASQIKPGQVFVFKTGSLLPKYIINFPTKRHWRERSQISDIDTGLKDLAKKVAELGIKSIAIPPLGCGNGGLNWSTVKPIILAAFANYPDVKVIIFEPTGSPQADKIPIAKKEIKMTRSRALYIKLLEIYGIAGYRLSRLEIQKLAYFLQEAGEPLKLRYKKDKYGPYADNLNHVLQKLDGAYIRGYGDRDSKSQIHVLPEGKNRAQKFLNKHPDAQEKIERICKLIEGFETPYGLEMLATVHWVTVEEPIAASDPDYAILRVQDWSERKREMFKNQSLAKSLEEVI
jgi:O-acetyl-ADP-ribose deacetylase (regulator of RNase III)